MLSEEVIGELWSWNFGRAGNAMQMDEAGGYVGVTSEERKLVRALAYTFGDMGMDKSRSAMNTIVQGALWYLGVFPESVGGAHGHVVEALRGPMSRLLQAGPADHGADTAMACRLLGLSDDGEPVK